ncbi:MAG TPA: class I adenylate-forming enzyme family protein [Acidimicrobiales bacterium]
MPTRGELIGSLTSPGAPFEITTTTIFGWNDIRIYSSQPASLRDVFEAGRERDDQAHLIVGDRQWTFAEVTTDVDHVAAGLVELGVGPGDRVAVLASNCREWVLTFWATVNIGAVVVGLNGFWGADEITNAIALTSPKLLVADVKRRDRITDRLPELAARGIDGVITTDDVHRMSVDQADASIAAPEISPDDTALVFFTSGTTGPAKGVPNTHRGVIACMQNVMLSALVGMQQAAASTPAGTPPAPPPAQPAGPVRTLVTSPMFHVSGCHAGIILGWMTGQTLVLPEGSLTADAITSTIERRRVTSWPAVPALVWRVVNDPVSAERDLSSVTRLSFGGAGAPPELIARVRERFPNAASSLATGWGLTETSAALTSHGGPAYAADPSDVGAPYPIIELRFVDPDSGAASATGPGEIWVRGCQVMSGYWNDPAATATVLDEDGWFRTGDVGHLDEAGSLHLTDRVKDVILRGGENVSATEVEHRILEHPAVDEVAVVGAPHPTLGEQVRAVVVPVPGRAPNVTPDVVRSWVAQTLAPFKVPSVVDVRTEPLPRNATGKLLKRHLRRELADPTEEAP